MFGIGALAMLILPTFGVYYLGRYQVPIAPPIAAGGAIALLSVIRLQRGRLR